MHFRYFIFFYYLLSCGFCRIKNSFKTIFEWCYSIIRAIIILNENNVSRTPFRVAETRATRTPKYFLKI